MVCSVSESMDALELVVHGCPTVVPERQQHKTAWKGGRGKERLPSLSITEGWWMVVTVVDMKLGDER